MLSESQRTAGAARSLIGFAFPRSPRTPAWLPNPLRGFIGHRDVGQLQPDPRRRHRHGLRRTGDAKGRHGGGRSERRVVPSPTGRATVSGALMDFTPHTTADVDRMLGLLGLSQPDDLFAHIPPTPANDTG